MEFSDKEVSKRSSHQSTNLTKSKPQSNRVRWKIDLVILPIFLITQALQFMDKTALNYANLFGYQKALGLRGQQFNYLSASMYSATTYTFNFQVGWYRVMCSGLCRILLWSIPLRLAHWSFPRSESACNQLLDVGVYGSDNDPMSEFL